MIQDVQHRSKYVTVHPVDKFRLHTMSRRVDQDRPVADPRIANQTVLYFPASFSTIHPFLRFILFLD